MRIDPIGTAELPISMEIVRAHLRAESGGAVDDALVELYTRGAVRTVETETRRVISKQRFRLTVEPSETIQLPVYPVATVDSIKVGAVTVPASSYDFRADLLPQEIRLVDGASWPDGSLVIEVTAGHAAGAMPEDLASAVLLLVGHRYENREDVVTGTIATPMPRAVKDICWNNRVAL